MLSSRLSSTAAKWKLNLPLLCFDDIDVIGWFRSKPSIVWVLKDATVWKNIRRKMEEDYSKLSDTWGVHCEG